MASSGKTSMTPSPRTSEATSRGVPPLVIESPKPPNCHPEREGGGWGGREGSPHKSWCRSTVIAEILRSPRTHPPLAQDDTNFGLVHRGRSFLRSGSATAVKGLRTTQNVVSRDPKIGRCVRRFPLTTNH